MFYIHVDRTNHGDHDSPLKDDIPEYMCETETLNVVLSAGSSTINVKYPHCSSRVAFKLRCYCGKVAVFAIARMMIWGGGMGWKSW